MGRNEDHLTEDALNDWLKSLVKRAQINTRGKIRFHLIRKFLMSQLSSSGMNQWETKLCVGKSIPSDILTYLKDQAQNLREKFVNAEPRFTLTGYTNANHSKIEKLEEEVTLVKESLETLAKVLAPLVVRQIKQHGGIDSYHALTSKERETLNRILTTLEREE